MLGVLYSLHQFYAWCSLFSPPVLCLVFPILSTSSMLGVLYSLHQFYAWCSLFSPPVLCLVFSILSTSSMLGVLFQPSHAYSLRQSHAWSVFQTYCRPMCSNLCTSQLPWCVLFSALVTWLVSPILFTNHRPGEYCSLHESHAWFVFYSLQQSQARCVQSLTEAELTVCLGGLDCTASCIILLPPIPSVLAPHPPPHHGVLVTGIPLYEYYMYAKK
jgi:hypothetical protein